MKFIYDILILIYKKIPFLRSFWINIIPSDITLPVFIEGKLIKVFKNHWASILLNTYEPQTLSVFRNLIKVRKNFVDIGANVGLFSSIAAENGLHVTSFEPHPKIREVLKSNLHGRNAKIYPYGLSNASSEEKLFISDEPGSHSLSLESEEFVPIEVKALDELISEKIDLVKIDVEGAEMNVLKGMNGLLQNFKPDIIIEVDEEHLKRFGNTATDLFSFLENIGYKYKKIGKEQNYLFLNETRNSLFGELGLSDDIIWIEWLGLWGSGKTTVISNITNSMRGLGEKVITPYNFFSEKRYKKLFLLFKSLPKTFSLFLKFMILVTPTFFKMYIKRDIVGLHEFRSFISCFLARLTLSTQKRSGIYLWEGEFHMLPILPFKKKTLDKLINFFLELNSNKRVIFVFMDVEIEEAKKRILHDHNIGNNLRFHPEKIDIFLNYLNKFNTNQDFLISRLEAKGQIVFKTNGKNINDIKFFLRSL
jgi:FkbM family methyltransferase